MNQYVTPHSKCVQEIMEVLGIQDRPITSLTFNISLENLMILTTEEYVKEKDFEQIVEILRKYKVTEENQVE